MLYFLCISTSLVDVEVGKKSSSFKRRDGDKVRVELPSPGEERVTSTAAFELLLICMGSLVSPRDGKEVVIVSC